MSAYVGILFERFGNYDDDVPKSLVRCMIIAPF